MHRTPMRRCCSTISFSRMLRKSSLIAQFLPVSRSIEPPYEVAVQAHRFRRHARPVPQVAGSLSEDYRARTIRDNRHRMRYIDAFNHFFPSRFYELMIASPAGQKDLGKRMRGIPALYDIDERLRVVDSFPDYTQILCLGMPAIDRLAGPDQCAGMGAARQ